MFKFQSHISHSTPYAHTTFHSMNPDRHLTPSSAPFSDFGPFAVEFRRRDVRGVSPAPRYHNNTVVGWTPAPQHHLGCGGGWRRHIVAVGAVALAATASALHTHTAAVSAAAVAAATDNWCEDTTMVSSTALLILLLLLLSQWSCWCIHMCSV